VPFVFFNVMSLAETGGGNWLHVSRANILTRELETIYTPSELAAFGPKWPCQPWVADLFDVSDDGVILTCNIGLPEPRPNGAFQMTYSIFDLDLSSRTLTQRADFTCTPWW
jgi:hypothetical protein